MSEKNIVITVSGPSTSGKTTFATQFFPLGYKEIVSTTTRPQRTGEVDGVNYYFVSDETFEKMVANNELVEHNNVGKYSYGVSKKAIYDVIQSGSPAVLVIEPNGANEVADYCAQKNIPVHKVFINNPIELLVKRLAERKATDLRATEEVYKERLRNIEVFEPENWTKKAYNGEHHYDQIFDTFNPENEKDVLNSVLHAVELKLSKKKANKIKIN